MSTYATRLENGKDTAARVRLNDAFGLLPGGPLRTQSGVRPDGGLAVTVVNGTMQVRVSPGQAWLDGPTTGQGGYVVTVDNDPSTGETITLDPGDSTGSRIDTIALQVAHNMYDASGNTLARVYALKGNPVTGAPPVVPAGSMALRDVTVPANRSAGNGGLAAANLGTDRRVTTAALGGIRSVASTSERDAITYKGRGMVVDNRATGALERWNGTGWDTFVPTTGPQPWTATPSNGSGSFTGSYEQVGKTVRARGKFTVDAGGITSTLLIALPVTPHASYTDTNTAVGPVHMFDASAGSSSRTGGTVMVTGASAFFITDSGTGGRTVGAATPWTWATGDTLGFTVLYEAA